MSTQKATTTPHFFLRYLILFHSPSWIRSPIHTTTSHATARYPREISHHAIQHLLNSAHYECPSPHHQCSSDLCLLQLPIRMQLLLLGASILLGPEPIRLLQVILSNKLGNYFSLYSVSRHKLIQFTKTECWRS